MCALVALSAAEHENESKKTKRGILHDSPYNQLSYAAAQPSLGHSAGQFVQSYAAQPIGGQRVLASSGGQQGLGSYGGQQGLTYRTVAAAPSLTYAQAAPTAYAVQPAVSYVNAAPVARSYVSSAPILRSVAVQSVPQVVIRERYPGNFGLFTIFMLSLEQLNLNFLMDSLLFFISSYSSITCCAI